jgi:hypothetical protein
MIQRCPMTEHLASQAWPHGLDVTRQHIPWQGRQCEPKTPSSRTANRNSALKPVAKQYRWCPYPDRDCASRRLPWHGPLRERGHSSPCALAY